MKRHPLDNLKDELVDYIENDAEITQLVAFGDIPAHVALKIKVDFFRKAEDLIGAAYALGYAHCKELEENNERV